MESLASADVGSERVQQLTRELAESLSAWDGDNYFGPDSDYQMIHVHDGARLTSIGTWHELAERDPRIVCIDGGLRSVEAGTRDDVLARDASPSYLAFRDAWRSMRTSVDAFVRAASERGSVPLDPQAIGWDWRQR